MGRSQGDSVIFFNDTDVDDHVAVIEWCDGNVVLYGISYYAIVQPLVAIRQPPALKGSSRKARTPTTFGTWRSAIYTAANACAR